VPVAFAGTVIVACPVLSSGALPAVAPSNSKFAVPVGIVGLADVSVTVAVSVMGWLGEDGLGEALTVVEAVCRLQLAEL